ncbi:hypothetical protein L6164_030446 [Bauhinia variegata]|uniref:Uncharacterized protein n=1 Tax=Bauhinia variegata TaxID=167791 RepID=A0ACB9LCA8_BAUVA|nr:hypothetical protein L6164_030446 [Bauhinia variegata]
MKVSISLFLLLLLRFLTSLSILAAEHDASSIIFTTLGRSYYAFDIYSLSTLEPPKANSEIRITDGQSVNFNGQFPSPSSSSFLLSLLPNTTGIRVSTDPPPLHLVYVTERNGVSNIYCDAVYYDDSRITRRRSALEFITDRVQIPLLTNQLRENRVSMKDKPSLTGEHLIYVSTHENPGVPRASWAAVYSTHLKSGLTRRLTPYGVADFSPAVSPSGIWTAVASYGS